MARLGLALVLLLCIAGADGASLLRKAAEPVKMARAEWEKSADNEVSYWDKEFLKPATDKENITALFDRETPLAPALRNYLNLPEEVDSSTITKLRILGVGSGMSSDIGIKSWPDAHVTLFLTDALADSYQKLYRKHNMYPPQPVIPLMGEDLGSLFEPNSFDLTVSINALDHSHEPLEAMKNMVKLTRPCRWAVVELYENEAMLEKGMGMHQWNFDKAEDGSARLRWYKAQEKPFNISAIMLEAGASEAHAQTWKGCFKMRSYDPCVRLQDTKLRMSFRKGPTPGEACPPNPRAPLPTA